MLKQSMVLATALCAFAACNKDKTQDNAQRAAEAVNDKAKDLRDEAKDVRETATDDRNDLADKIQDNREDLKKDLTKVADNAADRADKTADKAKDNVEDVTKEMKDVSKEVASLDEAQNEFVFQRNIRIATLRATHGLDASQAAFIGVLSANGGYETASQSVINEKLGVFNQRLDESATLIQSLEGVDANAWIERDKAAVSSMNRMEDARVDAWDAVQDAKRIDGRTSMR
jgi:archaellum component FlaC